MRRDWMTEHGHLPPESERGNCAEGVRIDENYEPTRKDIWLIRHDSYCPACKTIGNVISEPSSFGWVEATEDEEGYAAIDHHCTCCGYEFHLKYHLQLIGAGRGFLRLGD